MFKHNLPGVGGESLVYLLIMSNMHSKKILQTFWSLHKLQTKFQNSPELIKDYYRVSNGLVEIVLEDTVTVAWYSTGITTGTLLVLWVCNSIQTARLSKSIWELFRSLFWSENDYIVLTWVGALSSRNNWFNRVIKYSLYTHDALYWAKMPWKENYEE